MKFLKNRLFDYIKDPLYKNSLFLIAANSIVAIVGFVFWIIVARYYTTEDVGLATAVIAIIPFLAALAILGFDIGLVRFLPGEKDKPAMLNTCFTVTSLFAVITAAVYLLGLKLWSPDILFIRDNMGYVLLFVLFTVGLAISQLQGQAFIALRSAKYNLFQSVLYSSRVLLVIPFVMFGWFGIIDAWGVVTLLILVGGIAVFLYSIPGYKPLPLVKKDILKRLARFSAGNYAAKLIGMVPINWMPLIIISVLSKESSAYFYIPFSLASILGIIPGNVALSLLAEAANDPN
ncbi:MAG: oligosaccharide flippase family protein, partial [Dehalococcoidales bacterium]|nr:oligosaccharide flippase family protein [Dehalococcoidales bacterium]